MLYLPLLPLSKRGNARTFVLVMLCHVILTVFTLKKGLTSAINAPSHTWGLEDWLNTELSTQVNTTISVTYVASKLLQLLVCFFFTLIIPNILWFVAILAPVFDAVITRTHRKILLIPLIQQGLSLALKLQTSQKTPWRSTTIQV